MDAAAPETPAKLRMILNRISSNGEISKDDEEDFLNELEAYECWAPFHRLVQRSIDNPKRRTLRDYVRLAKVQNQKLEDLTAAAQTCARMVKDLKVDFKNFSLAALPEILAEDDFIGQATVLQTIFPALPSDKDRIACLERLSLIYEKKVFDEARLTKSYERLLEIDPRNMKALRYFKVLFTQNNEWDDVARILRSMLDSAVHRNDKPRIALELASTYLYQLDAPSMAVNLIEEYCQEGGLDTSTIAYDACQRLGDWEGCIKVLKDQLIKVDAQVLRSILYFKMGELYEKIGQRKTAREHYEKSCEISPKFLEPLERLIEMCLSEKDWAATLKLLDRLQGAVEDEELADRLREATTRLKHGLEHAR